MSRNLKDRRLTFGQGVRNLLRIKEVRANFSDETLKIIGYQVIIECTSTCISRFAVSVQRVCARVLIGEIASFKRNTIPF